MERQVAASELIGQSPAFLDALAHASDVAEVDRPVLIVGERGTGKELLAARMHFLSPRWEGPLIKLNCAAMNEELLESELFGHEAGAFTGASKKHRGRFERAEGGTLFLDEIASASGRVQEKLLRVIEYGEFERVGGEETLIASVRIVAAANVDLRTQAAEGKFRADLLDRLAFDVVAAPPLRDRREDIPLLAAHFATGMAAELEASFPGLAPEAVNILQGHHWPGNVRELKNAAERAMFHWARDRDTAQIESITIDPFDNMSLSKPPAAHAQKPAPTPAHTAKPWPTMGVVDLRSHLDEVERGIVTDALAVTGGSQKAAAERLGLSYDQLRGIVRKFEIDAKKIADYSAA